MEPENPKEQKPAAETKDLPKNWFDNDELFEKWKNYPSAGCRMDLADMEYQQLREGYHIPCGKPNVMNVNIPAGSRGGARPCGAMWKAFGGVYIKGQTERVYCSKCWVAYCLSQKISLEYAHSQLEKYGKKKE